MDDVGLGNVGMASGAGHPTREATDGVGAGRRPTPVQRQREALTDRRLELLSASGGFLIAAVCASAGAWAAFASWNDPRLTAIVVLGTVSAIGGLALASHFGVHIVATAARSTTVPPHAPGFAANALAPAEIWAIALVAGAGMGAATGFDLGTLVLIIGGRTPWGLTPATTMTAVVALPLVGVLPMAAAIGAAARRVWLRPPVIAAAGTWVTGTIVGTVASGVWAHLPGV